ncbi:hypothetical protein ACLBKU_07325 [Erythrobacter sp. NE805]|uniref:hypothetical protein n=1 Tax=Erythrobacter sp. NE805 TaxID=3389875 RepID=UPI00396AFA0C
MKTVSRIMLAAAASSLAVLPVAAEAGTRAGKSSVSVSAPGQGRAAKGQKQAESSALPIILGITAGGLVIYGVSRSGSSNDNGQSPGT